MDVAGTATTAATTTAMSTITAATRRTASPATATPSGGSVSPIASGLTSNPTHPFVRNGKEACEGRGYNQDQCDDVGCCRWDDGECRSAAGNDSCWPTSSSSGDSEESLADIPTYFPSYTWWSASYSSYQAQPACEGHDPETCGCGNVLQMDYRGAINTTMNGAPCARWDEDWIEEKWGIDFLQEFEGAGLEDGNFCRNPLPGEMELAWCVTDKQEVYSCDVPYCIPPPSSCYSLDSSDNIMTEELEDACAYHECTHGSDYGHSDDFRSPFRKEVGGECLCPYEIYDCKHGSGMCDSSKCCEESKDPDWMAASCECSIKNNCNWGDAPRCAEFVEICCGDDDNDCRCEYKMKACRSAMEKAAWDCDKGDNPWYDDEMCRLAERNGHEVSGDAKVGCCGDDWSIGRCASDHWELLCNEFSSDCDNSRECPDISEICCGEDDNECRCEYKTKACHFAMEEYTHVCDQDQGEVCDLAYHNALEICGDAKVGCCGDDWIRGRCASDRWELLCNDLSIQHDSDVYAIYSGICIGIFDDECKCEYQTKRCRFAAGKVSEHCDEDQGDEECRDAKRSAKNECRRAKEHCHNSCVGGSWSCECDHWELLCNDFPNSKDPDFCRTAAFSCCRFQDYCTCDFATYIENALGYRDPVFNSDNECADTDISPDHTEEEYSLQHIYYGTGGGRWYNSAGWMSELDHCTWYGIDCDDEGHVTKIDLRSNNMTGIFPSYELSELYRLHTLDLSDNQLQGVICPYFPLLFFQLRELKYVDLSQNYLTGEVDVLFAPAAEYVNFSHNNFSTVNSFKKFNPSHETLLSCDLSYNYIRQNLKDLMMNAPPNIEQLILSNNLIGGALPSIFKKLARLRHFNLGSNRLSGELPDFSASFPNLQVLNLSDQNQGANVGLTGTIPASLSTLPFLAQLSLAGNVLTSTIPSELGNLVLLRVLDLSNNELSETIPAELGRLGRGSGGALDRIDLSGNMLEGTIPVEFRNFEGASVLLRGNEQMEAFAPLSLCIRIDYDLKGDPVWCPMERARLVEFYNSVKGGEWTESGNWTDEYVSHCFWFGVKCDYSNNTIELNLTNNGLSGKLDGSIGYLPLLKRLDLSDNDIKGPIPPEVGMLSNLIYLRLAYNSFTGSVPEMLRNLRQLEMIQLNGNRLTGTITNISTSTKSDSSFIADCGIPSDFGDPIKCDKCTMCCNARGDCHPTRKSYLQKARFIDYMHFAGFFLGCTAGFSFALAVAVALHDKYKHRDSPAPRQLARTASTVGRDEKYSIETIGDDSVYKFFLGTSWAGWIVAFIIVGVQLWLLFIFVEGAEIDWTSEKSDLVFTYKCPRDEAECNNTSDLTPQGWVAFGILMAAHVLKDIINGLKLIVLSGKSRHGNQSRARFFLGGTLLFAVSSFTLLTSALYNKAIATSDTEVIMNSVVILFIMQVDEYCHDILYVLKLDRLGEDDNQPSEVVSGVGSRDGMDGSHSGVASGHEIESRSAGSQSLENIDMESLKDAVQALGEDVKYLKKENLELKKRLEVWQDNRQVE